MQPFHIGLNQGERIIAAIDTVAASGLPSILRGTVLAASPTAITLATDGEEVSAPMTHDDLRPALLLPWNWIRCIWLIDRLVEISPAEARRQAKSPRAAVGKEMNLHGYEIVGVRVEDDGRADWVPGDGPPIAEPPAVVFDTLGEADPVQGDFRAAFIAELDRMRKDGTLYG